MFALSAPVVMFALGGAYSYMTALQYRTEIQSAADAAALAATEAVIANSTTNGTTVATDYLAANAPATANQYGSFSILVGNDSDVVTAQVNYSGTMPTVFSSLFGATGMSIGVAAQAQGTVTGDRKSTTNASASVSGASFANGPASGPASSGPPALNSCVNAVAMCWTGGAELWGDPHVYGADGSEYYISCVSPAGGWYNALSDAGIEVNFSCLANPAIYADKNYLSAFSIMLDGHVIQFNAPAAVVEANGAVKINAATAWYGGVTIDGVYYPPQLGTTSYLGGSVITNIATLTSYYQQNDWVYVGNAHYSVAVTFGALGVGYLYIAAVNAGAQGSPGGILGETLAGINDPNSADFQVSSATSTTFQYDWTWPATTAATTDSKTPHLIQ